MQPTIHVLLTIVIVSVKTGGLIWDAPRENGAKTAKMNELKCTELGKQPHFEMDMVTGEPWHVVHTWTKSLKHTCVNITFNIVTPEIAHRFYSDTSEYLQEQPSWGGAAVVMSMGKNQRSVLLLDSNGPEGRMDGVPNILRDNSGLKPVKGEVPLLKFLLKLTKDKTYLLLMDCIVGFAVLATRALVTSNNRTAVQEAAHMLAPILGPGRHACLPSTKDGRMAAIARGSWF